MLYKLADKDTGEEIEIYGVDVSQGETYFLNWLDEYSKFGWIHSSYFEPIKKKKKLPDPPRPDLPELQPMTAHERYKSIKKQERLERKNK